MGIWRPQRTSLSKRVLLTFVLSAVSVPPQVTADPLTAFDAFYVLRTKGVRIGTMHQRLQPGPGNNFVFQSDTRPSGLIALFKADRIIETSTWRRAGDAIFAISYRYQRLGGRKPREDKTDFAWERGVVDGVHKNRIWQTQLPPNTVDKLLYQLLIMRDLSRDQLQQEYQIADGGRIKSYQIFREGEETVKTPLGEFQTIRLRRGQADEKRRTTFWCSPRLSYLPVRVDYREKDGVVTTALLKQVSGLQALGE